MFINKNYYLSLIIIVFSECVKGSSETSLEIGYSSFQEEYVDPHSFHYNKHDKRVIEKPLDHIGPNLKAKTCREVFNNCLNGYSQDIPDELFSRRLINRLLSIVTFEENDELLIGNIVLELTKAELIRLKDFSLGKVLIRDIDTIIPNVFRAPETTVFMDVFSMSHKFVSKLYSVYCNYIYPHKELLFTALLIIQISRRLVRTEWTCFRIIITFVMISFFASCVISYFQLLKFVFLLCVILLLLLVFLDVSPIIILIYKEAEIKLTAKQFKYNEMPAVCQQHKMSWFQNLWSHFYDEEQCVKYYEAVMEDHRLHVTPVQVLSRVMGTFILEPASLTGRAIADFVHHATGHVSRPIQWILQPLLVIAMIMAIIIGVVFVVTVFIRSIVLSPFSLLRNFMHGDSQKGTRRLISKATREPIEVILNLKMSTQAQEATPITHTTENCQFPMIKDKMADGEKLKAPKKLANSGGDDADQSVSSQMNDKSFQDSSTIDDMSNGEILQQINNASGVVNVRLRKKAELCQVADSTDSEDS